MTDVLDRSAGRQGDRPATLPVPDPTTDRAERTRHELSTAMCLALASLSAAAGVIHLAMVPSHSGTAAFEGVAFAVAGWLQIAFAVALVARPRFLPTLAVLRFAVVVNVALIVAWAMSRTIGLPWGEHAWHPETAGFVDVAVVAMEAAFVVGAGALLLRPRLGRGSSWSRLALGAIVPIGVVALATGALASPSARDHASHSHGDHAGATSAGHGHGHEASADDNGLAALDNGHQHGSGAVALDNATQAALSGQLAQTARLVERYPTIAAAEAAGYNRAGPFAPGLGTHYMGFGGATGGDAIMGPEGPMVPLLIYDGLTPDAPIAGFMYLIFGGAEGEPEGFVGPNDHWHYHTNTCLVFKDGGIEAPLGADIESVTEEQCARYGGSLVDNTGYMVHVWTVPGYESPRGVFSNINPKLTCPDGTYHAVPLDELGFRTSTCRSESG